MYINSGRIGHKNPETSEIMQISENLVCLKNIWLFWLQHGTDI